MELKIGEKYLLMRGTSYAQESTVESGHYYFYEAYKHYLIRIIDIIEPNSIFVSVLFIILKSDGYEMDMDSGVREFQCRITFCKDNELYKLIPFKLLSSNYLSKGVKNCYSYHDLEYIMSPVSDEFIKKFNNISKLEDTYRKEIHQLRKSLQDDAITCMNMMGELKNYDNNINIFLDKKNENNRIPD